MARRFQNDDGLSTVFAVVLSARQDLTDTPPPIREHPATHNHEQTIAGDDAVERRALGVDRDENRSRHVDLHVYSAFHWMPAL